MRDESMQVEIGGEEVTASGTATQTGQDGDGSEISFEATVRCG